MPLSRNWTAREIWQEAFRRAGFPQNDAVYIERFRLINRAVIAVVGQVYDLLKQSYITEAIAVISTTTKYKTGDAGWTAATRTLTATMNTGFSSSTDLENLVVFHEGTNGYAGYIESVGGATSVVLRAGGNLPDSDIALASITYVQMLGTGVTASVVSLSNINIMRYGQQIAMDLESSVTTTLEPVTLATFRKFRSSSQENLTKIVWVLHGDDLYLAKGDSLASFGTLTLHYPRVPDEVAVDTELIDVADGTAIELVIMKLQSLIAERIQFPLGDQTAEAVRLIGGLYQTFGVALSDEEVKEKAQALK